MKVNGQYNSMNSVYGTQENSRVQCKQRECHNKKPQMDTYTRSTQDDADYMKHMAAYNQYMAILASTAIKVPKYITPVEELEFEPQPEFPSPVEKSGNSNPTHNNETHHYNQDQNAQGCEDGECCLAEVED